MSAYFKAEENSIVCMYSSYLIQSSVDVHCVCLHVLAIVNSAEMNIGVHVSFLICPGVGLLDHTAPLFLIF